MIRHHFPTFAIAAALLAWSARAIAQDEKPADQPAKPAAKAPAKGAAAAEAPSTPYRPDDPAVETILDAKPTAPRDLMQAIISLNQLDRPDLAKQFIDKLLAAKPSPAELANLAHQFGSAVFIEFSTDKNLLPQSRTLATLVLSAASAERQNPDRLAALAKQLSDRSPEVQRDAALSLREAGAAAVPLLVAVAADKNQSAAALARAAIAEMGAEAVPPLTAALQTPSPAENTLALELLGDSGSQDAILYLLKPYLSPKSSPEIRHAAEQALLRIAGVTATRGDAKTMLGRDARAYLHHEKVLRGETGDAIVVWFWNPATRRIEIGAFPSRQAVAFYANRLASDLFDLFPDADGNRRLYLLSLLESGAYRVGIDKPLPTGADTEFDRAAKFGVAAINDVLAQALADGNTVAAKGAAQILGAIGDAKLLEQSGAEPSPLVQSLRSNDRRLRMAAAAAVMKLKPSAPFAGSSYLTDVLAELATSTGHRRAVIGFPTLGPLQRMAGLSNALGFDSVTATNGQALFEAATGSADTELILVSNRLDHQPAFETVQQLLRDPRTANVPICVVAEPGERDRAIHFFEKFPGVFVELLPRRPEDMQQIVARAQQIAGDRIVPATLRAAAAGQALDALATLADFPPEVFDVRRYEPIIERALFRSATSSQAAAVTARLSTPASQLALVDLASTATQSLKARQAAAAAFADSVRRVGVRLSPSEILRQYDRYNQSKSLDKPTQQVLGALLDTIEGQQPTHAL